MNLYETTFIINPQTDDATINGHVREIASVITDNDGKIHYEDHMGTRRLAYEIQGLTQGYYASFIFEAPTSLLPKLSRHYKLNEQYIRHLTVRFEGDLSKLVGDDEGEGEKAEEKPAAEPKPAAAETAPTEPKAEAETEETAEAEAEAETAESAPEAETEEKKAESGAGDEEQELYIGNVLSAVFAGGNDSYS